MSDGLMVTNAAPRVSSAAGDPTQQEFNPLDPMAQRARLRTQIGQAYDQHLGAQVVPPGPIFSSVSFAAPGGAPAPMPEVSGAPPVQFQSQASPLQGAADGMNAYTEAMNRKYLADALMNRRHPLGQEAVPGQYSLGNPAYG